MSSTVTVTSISSKLKSSWHLAPLLRALLWLSWSSAAPHTVHGHGLGLGGRIFLRVFFSLRWRKENRKRVENDGRRRCGADFCSATRISTYLSVPPQWGVIFCSVRTTSEKEAEKDVSSWRKVLSVPILVGKVKFCVEENPEEKQKPNGTGPQVWKCRRRAVGVGDEVFHWFWIKIKGSSDLVQCDSYALKWLKIVVVRITTK